VCVCVCVCVGGWMAEGISAMKPRTTKEEQFIEAFPKYLDQM
jgi:hypothetical protein